MANNKIFVTGIKQIDKKLNTLANRIASKVVRKAERTAMKPMQQEVEREAPIGESGDLEREVKLRAGRRSRTAISMNVYLSHADFEKFYAAFVLYGAITHPEPDPFMLRAAVEQGNASRNIAISEILKGADREIKKAP